MRLIENQIEGEYILSNKDVLLNVGLEHFSPDYLKENHQLEKISAGRGAAWRFIWSGKYCVLRHYCRGGLAAKFCRDHYIWLGLPSTRAWREMHLLSLLKKEQYPVPQVLAARVKRSGIFYTADLITEQIQNAQALSEFLRASALPASKWREIGTVIKRFHQRGVYHADLNAHNILLSGNDVYLIDFDKCKLMRSSVRWQQANLMRLRRSLDKLSEQNSVFGYRQHDWNQLLSGYNYE